MDPSPDFGGGERALGPAASARVPTDRIEELEAGIERLLLITEAMWEMLREQHGFEENELIRRIAQIDMRDGRYDHRVATTPPDPCPKCGRVVGKHRTRCLFCGEPIAMRPFQR